VRIAIDAAGCEPGHRVVIEGVKKVLDETASSPNKIVPVIYGSSSDINEEIQRIGIDKNAVEIVNTPHVVEMSDQPREVLLKKPNSSIIRAVKDLASGLVDAFVSMGNTGAVVGSSRAFLGRIRWINKPALGVPFPRTKGMGFLIDAGAVPDPKPSHLLQFAAMGSAFTERVYGIPEPKVGLLNIGSESNKGDERSLDTYKLLSKSPLNFIGNIEGGDLFKNIADVIVTTGFVGNVILKMTEAVPDLLSERFADKGIDLSENGLLSDLDYRRYGGATLLGVDGTVVIGHGRSSAEAVSRAILWADKMVHGKVIDALRDRVFKTRRAIWLTNPFARGDSSEES